MRSMYVKKILLFSTILAFGSVFALPAADALLATTQIRFIFNVDPSSSGIRDDGRGTYIDGQDGVTVYQDQAFHANPDAKRVSSPRTLIFDLSSAIGNAQNLGIITSIGGEVYVEEAGLLAIGESRLARAKFVLGISQNNDHQLWFGRVDGDGTNKVTVTRLSQTQWVISAPAGAAVAELSTGTRTLVPVGHYNVPFQFNTQQKL